MTLMTYQHPLGTSFSLVGARFCKANWNVQQYFWKMVCSYFVKLTMFISLVTVLLHLVVRQMAAINRCVQRDYLVQEKSFMNQLAQTWIRVYNASIYPLLLKLVPCSMRRFLHQPSVTIMMRHWSPIV